MPRSAHPALRPYLKNALYLKPDQTPCADAMGTALETLAEEGNRNSHAKRMWLPESGWGRNKTCICGEYDISARSGAVFETDEYRGTEVRIGELSFDCIDFGEHLKLNTSLQKKLHVGGDIDAKKCTILALAAGVEWISQGQPRRCPSRQRIDLLARDIRMGEILGAAQAQEQSTDEETRSSWDIRAICHDISNANHERDCQALGMFLLHLPEAWKFSACEVAATEIHPNDKAVYHLYHACPVGGGQSMIFLVAHRGHMMWSNPTASMAEREWRVWLVSASQGEITNHPAMGWKQRSESQTKEDRANDIKPTLHPFGHCGLTIKVGLTVVAVGSYGSPQGVEENKPMQNNPSGMAASAFLGFPHPVLIRIDVDPFPTQERDWMETTTLTWEAQVYASACGNHATFFTRRVTGNS